MLRVEGEIRSLKWKIIIYPIIRVKDFLGMHTVKEMIRDAGTGFGLNCRRYSLNVK